MTDISKELATALEVLSMARSKSREAYEALSPEEKAAMYEAQRQSLARGMAPCEHGERDWETCPACLAKYGGSNAK